MEAVFFAEQINQARNAADLQKEQIRQQQVQLRLQQGQSEIVRLKQLRQVLATDQVQLGARNIAPDSGSIKAITETNVQNFMADEAADNLNFLGKQQSLNISRKQVDMWKRAQYVNAAASLYGEVKQAAVAVATGGMGGGGGATSSGGASGGNLMEYGSGGDNMNLNQ